MSIFIKRTFASLLSLSEALRVLATLHVLSSWLRAGHPRKTQLGLWNPPQNWQLAESFRVQFEICFENISRPWTCLLILWKIKREMMRKCSPPKVLKQGVWVWVCVGDSKPIALNSLSWFRSFFHRFFPCASPPSLFLSLSFVLGIN